MLGKAFPAIRMLRLPIALGAACDCWLAVILAKSGDGRGPGDLHAMSWSASLTAAAMVAGGLAVHGVLLNDLLDARHDATFNPGRAIPSGRLGPTTAAAASVGALLVALLGATWFGLPAVGVTLLVAMGILFYDLLGRYVPAVGMLTIGLLHAAILFLPDPGLLFTLPAWLVMTHEMTVAILEHVLQDKRPRVSRRAVLAMGLGWIAATTWLLGLGAARGGWLVVDVVDLVPPLVAVAGFGLLVLRAVRRVDPAIGARRVRRLGTLWHPVYGTAWLLMLGLPGAALWLGAAGVGGMLLLALVRELAVLPGRAATYR